MKKFYKINGFCLVKMHNPILEICVNKIQKKNKHTTLVHVFANYMNEEFLVPIVAVLEK